MFSYAANTIGAVRVGVLLFSNESNPEEEEEEEAEAEGKQTDIVRYKYHQFAISVIKMCQQHACNQYLQLSKYARRVVCHDEWHRVVLRMCKMYDICHNCQLMRPIAQLFIVLRAGNWKRISAKGCERRRRTQMRAIDIETNLWWTESTATWRDKYSISISFDVAWDTNTDSVYVNVWCSGLVWCHILVFLPLKKHIIPFNFTGFWAEALCLSIRIRWCHMPSIHVRRWCSRHRGAKACVCVVSGNANPARTWLDSRMPRIETFPIIITLLQIFSLASSGSSTIS